MSILAKIRQKPDNQKKLFSFMMAIILTLVIVVVWYSFISNTGPKQIAGEETPNTLSSLSPMQVIKDEFSKAFSNLSGKVSGSDGNASSTVPIEIVTDNLAGTNTEDIGTTSTSSEEIII